MQIITDHIMSRFSKIRVWSSAAGTPLPGSITGRQAGPFRFERDVSDKFKVTVGTALPQTVTLTGVDISAQAVADQMNATSNGLNATATADNRLMLAAVEPTDPLIVNSVTHDCYAVLGFSVGHWQRGNLYAPGPYRPHGEMIPPCIALSHHMPMAVDLAQTRPHIDVFTASEAQRTIQIPDYMGGGELTGPAEWTWKPFPTPVRVYYQIDRIATDEAQAEIMDALILEALPMPYRFEINGRWALMLPQGDPHNLDELEAPLFRTAYRYEVSNVWIDRQAAVTKPSIGEVDMEFGSMR